MADNDGIALISDARRAAGGEDAGFESTLWARLAHAASFLREKLLHRLQIKRVPELVFVLDENIEYSFQISKLLKTIEDEEA